LAKLARNQAGSAVAREAVHQEFPGLDDETVAELPVDYNVIAQVRNLLTHSFIRDDLWNGRIGTEPHPPRILGERARRTKKASSPVFSQKRSSGAGCRLARVLIH
jgi:hypothetical protein